jgi:tetratricopeptide (TPR) repeat protein
MELVPGVPITKYCDENRLSPRQRLELFVPVCQAIQHAHQKGIIHRDIKPSNVLVTLHDGLPVPKVIDFGVAKATEQRLTEKTLFTQFGTMVGTLEYMAPEQAEMSGLGVDTRGDIYSLGVLLYELLTGTTPLERKRLREAAYDEVLRLIREEEPPKPSQRISTSGEHLATISTARATEPAKLSRLVRGELDWIVMRCLEKDRTRRYETVNGLARDVQRYLHDEPVEACPPSAGYKLRKLARKHRAGIMALTAFAVFLLAGIAVSSVLAVRARQAEQAAMAARDAEIQQRRQTEEQRDRALKAEMEAKAAGQRAADEAAISRAVNDFLQQDLLGLVDSDAQVERRFEPDPNVKARTLLDRAADEIGKRFQGQPRVEGAVRQAIGQAYQGLTAYDQALLHLTRARDLRVSDVGPDHPDTLKTLFSLATAYDETGQYAEAIQALEKVRDRQAATLSADHPERLRTLVGLGKFLLQAGRPAEAEPMLRECLAVREKTNSDDWSTFNARQLLGAALVDQKKYAEAEPLMVQGYEGLKQNEAKIPPFGSKGEILEETKALERLVQLYEALGKTDKADEWRKKLEALKTAKKRPANS